MYKIIIYGASNEGKNLLSLIDDEVFCVQCFVDKNKNLYNGSVAGIVVDFPENIHEHDFDFIVISSSRFRQEIQIDLNKLGVSEDKIFVYYDNSIINSSSNIVFPLNDNRVLMLKSFSDEIYLNNVDGSVAEVGVYKGNFAKYINKLFPDRKLYLFDTFCGFDQRDLEKEKEIGSNITSNVEFTDIESDVISIMPNREKIEIRKGYFPESINGLEDRFCFVSLDPDLYNPILSGLEYFYPRLTHGGYIAIHDFGTQRFSGAAKAVREFCKVNNISYVPMQDRGLSAVIGR